MEGHGADLDGSPEGVVAPEVGGAVLGGVQQQPHHRHCILRLVPHPQAPALSKSSENEYHSPIVCLNTILFITHSCPTSFLLFFLPLDLNLQSPASHAKAHNSCKDIAVSTVEMPARSPKHTYDATVSRQLPGTGRSPAVTDGSDPEAFLGSQGLGALQQVAPLGCQLAALGGGLLYLHQLHCRPPTHPPQHRCNPLPKTARFRLLKARKVSICSLSAAINTERRLSASHHAHERSDGAWQLLLPDRCRDEIPRSKCTATRLSSGCPTRQPVLSKPKTPAGWKWNEWSFVRSEFVGQRTKRTYPHRR